MDPQQTWQALLDDLRALQANPDDQNARTSAIFFLEALARWLRSGGFPPTID